MECVMGKSPLSDWERDELVYYRRRGWDWYALASYYGISERSAERIYKREEGRDKRCAPPVVSGGANA